jgi:hypothetical protein
LIQFAHPPGTRHFDFETILFYFTN